MLAVPYWETLRLSPLPLGPVKRTPGIDSIVIQTQLIFNNLQPVLQTILKLIIALYSQQIFLKY